MRQCAGVTSGAIYTTQERLSTPVGSAATLAAAKRVISVKRVGHIFEICSTDLRKWILRRLLPINEIYFHFDYRGSLALGQRNSRPWYQLLMYTYA